MRFCAAVRLGPAGAKWPGLAFIFFNEFQVVATAGLTRYRHVLQQTRYRHVSTESF
jgi:hypothetical protein